MPLGRLRRCLQPPPQSHRTYSLQYVCSGPNVVETEHHVGGRVLQRILACTSRTTLVSGRHATVVGSHRLRDSPLYPIFARIPARSPSFVPGQVSPFILKPIQSKQTLSVSLYSVFTFIIYPHASIVIVHNSLY
jgi:hypothetical protein